MKELCPIVFSYKRSIYLIIYHFLSIYNIGVESSDTDITIIYAHIRHLYDKII